MIGEHRGYARYTIGQRKGLPGGVGRGRGTWWRSGPSAREVVVGTADELDGHRVHARGAQLAGADPLGRATRCGVQIRYRARGVPATVLERRARQRSSWRWKRRSAPSRPGQSGVLYDAEGRVLGGGVIA